MEGYQNPFLERKHYYEHTEWIAEHISQYFGESPASVFTEIPVLDLRVDVHLIRPENAPFNILLTSGMSTLEMEVDEGIENPEELAFAELMLLIPKNIEFGQVYTGENVNDWILTILKRTAKFPHFYNTWIGVGHTIQAEADLSPYGHDTDYVAGIILPSLTFDRNFTEIRRDGRKINIYCILPLYMNELEFKIEKGYNAFVDLLKKWNGPEILDLNRENLISKKSLWDRFLRK
ncbi:suppressor of fused domain protein [Aureisphaera galaxeae]|uniref:suppressor of fused domain protein n=1 Tax=Aureisphaera galaxeae TaxID=1538023 RepID=UPI00235008E4|nr:suppressor of fused domain protein [Aureisphaera galaxeae]MDC8003606.1 suppressor of fused domain protein [Aureisphaera galaxeae]